MEETVWNLEVLDDRADATERVYEMLDELLQEKKDIRVRVALAGGSTPKGLYELLAERRDVIDLNRIDWFFGDERSVGPEDEASNYRMVKKALFDPAGISPENVFRIKGELSPQEAAADYIQNITKVFQIDEQEIPTFDLILLGMGTDAHIASLFPFTKALTVKDRSVVANEVPQLETWRVTLTVPVLHQAEEVIILACGDDKAEALQNAFSMTDIPEQFPIQLLLDRPGITTFVVDEAAAKLLDSEVDEE